MLPLLEANADQIMLKFFPKFKRGLTDDVSALNRQSPKLKILSKLLMISCANFTYKSTKAQCLFRRSGSWL